MKAVVIRRGESGIQTGFEEVPKPVAGPGEALVQLQAASLNRRDHYLREGLYPNIQFPCIPGSDGSGVVEAVGSDADSQWVGQTIFINSALSYDAATSEYDVLGMPSDGTLAEYVVVRCDRLHKIPAHLSPEQASAFPLAGATAYRALYTQGQLSAGQDVLITGIGGGVSQIAFEFCKATGANIYVTSGSEEKIAAAIEAGARGGFNYRKKFWYRKAKKEGVSFDLIIDGAGGDGFDSLIAVLKPCGRLVSYGKTAGDPPSLNLHQIFWNQVSIIGSVLGDDLDFENMVRFVAEHKIIAPIDSVLPFEECISGLDLLRDCAQTGKIVIRFSAAAQ
ncbi:MAG: zinc-binding alcohol dehydrogenase/oxidoreductase [Verrucomicrobiales bacterium]